MRDRRECSVVLGRERPRPARIGNDQRLRDAGWNDRVRARDNRSAASPTSPRSSRAMRIRVRALAPVACGAGARTSTANSGSVARVTFQSRCRSWCNSKACRLGILALAAGSHHTCALRDDGGVFCWGRNDRGQLGVAIAPGSSEPCVDACSTFAVVAGGFAGRRAASDVDAGTTSDASAMIARDGAARDVSDAATASDANRSDAGRRDALTVSDASVLDVGMPGASMIVTSIATGDDFTCARLDDATLRCWGANRAGQIGDGQISAGGPEPVMVIASPGSAATNPLQNAVTIEAGGGTACALSADRSLRCWGSNEAGALGDGTITQQSGPVPCYMVDAVCTVVSVANVIRRGESRRCEV